MYPRRVKDLPRLEPDSEDEFNTPLKQKATKAAAFEKNDNCNKENETLSNNTSLSTSSGFKKFRMYPKRSSELPALESDSDEDDNLKDDNLNCAILNDSFIMSPARSEQDDSCSTTSLTHEQQKKTSKTKNDASSSNLSFLSRFDQMVLNGDESFNQSPIQIKDSSVSTLTTQKKSVLDRKTITTSVCTMNSIEENKISAPLQRYNSDMPPHQQQTQPAIRKDLETPFKSNSTSSEPQFVTPQIRSFSVQRRPRDLCSTQSQKTRSAIVNEFRSQKVLFQTPMAMSRAPMTCLPNDSITLSLCDSINEQQGTPNTAEKMQLHSEKDLSTTKSKKSLEGVFNDFEQSHGCSGEAQKSANTAKSSDTCSESTKNSKNASTTSNNKETNIQINNGSYAIIKKLGAGGSSSVYLAQRKDNGKEFALKIVDLRGDAAVVEGYLNETKLLAKLQGNVCVVSLYEYQLLQKESKLYLVMEKGDSDLHKILQTYTTNLPLYVLMNFWYQMLQAVNYIHQNGVIHSDLKPANFLMINGRLKLIDFGIASNIAIDSTSIIKFSQAGTFNYISPEALTDTSTGSSPMRNQPKIKISTKSDVWSLGCILYLLLYKKTPFSHILNIYAKISAISSPTPSIDYPAIPPYYPAMLVHMAKNCLQHNPKQRPSCAELLKYPFHMVIPIQNLTVPPK